MIKIDLRNLTQAKLELSLKARAEAQAEDNYSCKYSAPCIIGTLIPEDAKLDSFYDSTGVGHLLAEMIFEAPEDQHDQLKALQNAFDAPSAYTADQVRQLAAPWITT